MVFFLSMNNVLFIFPIEQKQMNDLGQNNETFETNGICGSKHI